MAMTLAKVQVVGYLGKVEAKYSPDGKFICEFSVAHSTGKDEKKNTTWFGGALWEKQGELFNQMCKKGSLVFLDGELEEQQWKDKDGHGHSKLVIRVSAFRLLANGKEKDDPTPYDGE